MSICALCPQPNPSSRGGLYCEGCAVLVRTWRWRYRRLSIGPERDALILAVYRATQGDAILTARVLRAPANLVRAVVAAGKPRLTREQARLIVKLPGLRPLSVKQLLMLVEAGSGQNVAV